jgi:hypothetical protein
LDEDIVGWLEAVETEKTDSPCAYILSEWDDFLGKLIERRAGLEVGKEVKEDVSAVLVMG